MITVFHCWAHGVQLIFEAAMHQPLKPEEQRGTHYAYRGGKAQGTKYREPSKLYDLTNISTNERRKLIGFLIRNGELLAACPFGVTINNLKQLRAALDWLAEEDN